MSLLFLRLFIFHLFLMLLILTLHLLHQWSAVAFLNNDSLLRRFLMHTHSQSFAKLLLDLNLIVLLVLLLDNLLMNNRLSLYGCILLLKLLFIFLGNCWCLFMALKVYLSLFLFLPLGVSRINSFLLGFLVVID
jgi:hypothetical protein